MTAMPWFRAYSDLLSDIKIRRIAKNTCNPKALVIGVWITMLAIANQSDERGRLMVSEKIPCTIDDLMDETELDEDALETLLAEFQGLEMISRDGHISIKNWNKRQYSEVVKGKAKSANDEPKEWLPEALGTIERAFIDASGIKQPETPERGWIKALEELDKMGATPEVIKDAVKKLRKDGMTIAHPRGVLITARAMMATNVSEIRIGPDGEQIEL